MKAFDYSYDTIVRRANESLERLGIDQIDVLYIHDAMGQPMDEIMSPQGALGALRHLQASGMVRYIGTAANDPRHQHSLHRNW